MNAIAWAALVTCVLAAAIGSAILSRDPGQRANRLIAKVLACAVGWSLCELLWNLSDDPEHVVRLVRASGAAWLWLGPLGVDILVELMGDSRSRLRRIVPWTYAAAALSIVLYVATPWGVREAVQTPWGWGYRFGPVFPGVYSVTTVCVALVVANWHRTYPQATRREKRLGRWMLVGIVAPLVAASVTDVALPYLGIVVPRVGSASLLIVGCMVAWSVRRHGFLMLAPGAFTREIVETIQDGVLLAGRDGCVLHANAGLARLAGASAAELSGVPIARLLPELRLEHSPALTDVETQLQPIHGEPVPVLASTSPLRDDGGEVVGSVLALRDLVEVTSLRRRLVTSGRLAAVGELAAGIANEIASPVGRVRANLVELRERWQSVAEAARKHARGVDLDPIVAEGEELIEESVEGIDRVASIVKHVGAFSHAGRGRSERVDLNALLEEVLGVAVLSFSVVIERCYAELPPVSCDPQQLKQAFLNLLLNALQAVGDMGCIRIVTQVRGDSVLVRLQDDGPGIPEDAIDRIFDPFFTTRPTGSALGLGLAQCHQIVRNHGGEIRVTSNAGRGASFEVRLPASAA